MNVIFGGEPSVDLGRLAMVRTRTADQALTFDACGKLCTATFVSPNLGRLHSYASDETRRVERETNAEDA